MEHLLYHLTQHIAQSVPSLSLVDEDYGQLENLDQTDRDMYPITFPCVLVELTEAQWSNIKGNSQKGDVRFRVRLIVDCYDDTHIGSTTSFAILERDDLRRSVDACLQGHHLRDEQASGNICRERSTYFTTNHGIKVYETHYSLTLSEDFAPPVQTAQRPTVTIKASPKS